MPIEERFIKFTLNEVLEALKILSDRGKISLPKSSLMSAKEIVLPDGGLAVEFKFRGVNEIVVVPNAVVAAALIGYCGRFKIPIPKNANKGIAMKDLSVMLRISSVGAIVPNAKQSKGMGIKKKCGKGTKEQDKTNNPDSEEFLI